MSLRRNRELLRMRLIDVRARSIVMHDEITARARSDLRTLAFVETFVPNTARH